MVGLSKFFLSNFFAIDDNTEYSHNRWAYGSISMGEPISYSHFVLFIIDSKGRRHRAAQGTYQ